LALHDDLLKQSKHLAANEPRRPKQASLRRAVSAAYYALFHFLISEATSRLITGRGREDIRAGLGRSFDHGTMNKAALETTKPRWGRMHQLQRIAVPADLVTVAKTFGNLQQARHEADYDTTKTFTRAETQALIDDVDQAIALWATLHRSIAADAFLSSLIAFAGMCRG
jgi:uncharacterized protein (UPF0332 family)